MVAAALVLAGCASSGYDGYYAQYPNQTYHGYDPYYRYDPYYSPYYGGYGTFGYGSVFKDNFDHRRHRFFHPDDHVTCDRARDICYDRYGPSYTATKRYLGERNANGAFRRYGDRIVLFSPKRGITCDRRARTCSDSGGVDEDLTQRFFGDRDHRRIGSPADEDKAANMLPRTRVPGDEVQPLSRHNRAMQSNDDDGDIGQAISRPRPQGMAESGGNGVRQPRNTEPDRSAPNLLRRHENAPAGGAACPPTGCSSK